jgi:hypothetical protein
MRRFLGTTIVLVVVAAACGGGGAGDRPADGGATPGATEQVEGSPNQEVVSALQDPNHESFPAPLIEWNDLRSGGPPPDGIPSIDAPRFLRVDEVDFLADQEPVLAIEVEGDARAYPLQIMTWHEIVNDTIGGIPVTVSYCPLCNSAVAYDRRAGDLVLDFGTSGMLYNSALVMYDRQTESLWLHFTGEAAIGHLAGTRLETIPVQTIAWRDWRTAHPDGLVLSRDTGHDRDYGRNPYPGYDDVDNPPFLFDGPVDGRYPAKTRVLGVRSDSDPVAIVLDHLRERRVVEFALDGRDAVAWLVPGAASGLDRTRIPDGRDVGATGVFEREVDGRVLAFEPAGDGFRDLETGSTWNVLGEATGGTLAGRTLTRLEHVDTFWFAWGAYVPDGRVIDATSR